jgi:Uma2 family endonuclease
MPLSEYLATTYRPDREFVDGEIRERNVGERSHSSAQMRVLELLRANRLTWNIVPLPELRVQVATQRFRIPDVSALRQDAPYEEVVRHAPLLCVEILSKDDRMSDMLERVEDYLRMGVACVWVIDPRTRRGYEHTVEGSHEARQGVLCVPSTPVQVLLSAIFEE